ncbi:hypothetical protein [Arthrobacter sp. H41]|uniref:hypothetical protein n=1 Tax=Arthrobacter sp. H41 TaxID=1312978 RepID=UPI00047A2AC8|nr:hypothetical protein [Arthrobacter sp. H41]
MDLFSAARISGVPEDSIHQLLALRLIEPVTTHPDQGPLFSADQRALLEILAGMDVLNFRLEEMRDMARIVETLTVTRHSETAEQYRVRLSAFTHSLTRRAVASEQQIRSRTDIIGLLTSRYPWLNP